MYNLCNVPNNLLDNILKYFQTHVEYKTPVNKYEARIIHKVKTDIVSIINLGMSNFYFYNYIFNSENFKIFWVVYYNSHIVVSKNCTHTLYCKNKNCKNISHLINKSRNKKYTNLKKKIKNIK